jgi:excisionase family DNA binding protein
MANNEQVYTPAEVAKILKLSQETIRRKMRSGELKAYKEGRLWRITTESISQYIKNKQVE